MTYSIDRAFNHRGGKSKEAFGHIGDVKLEAVAKGKNVVFLLDGKELPEISARYLLEFSLQSLQDAYAGSNNAAEAVAAFEKKRDALTDGTIGVRTGGGGADEWTTVARAFVKKSLKAKLGGDAYKTRSEADDFASYVDKIVDKNRENDKFKSTVDAEVDRRQREREEKAKIAAAVELDI